MELCEHCDIVHNEYQCPLCKTFEEIDRLKEEIADLKYKLEKEIEN